MSRPLKRGLSESIGSDATQHLVMYNKKLTDCLICARLCDITMDKKGFCSVQRDADTHISESTQTVQQFIVQLIREHDAAEERKRHAVAAAETAADEVTSEAKQSVDSTECSKTSVKMLTLHISKSGEPSRRIRLPADHCSFGDLHIAIQRAYDFNNSHLFSFRLLRPAYDRKSEALFQFEMHLRRHCYFGYPRTNARNPALTDSQCFALTRFSEVLSRFGNQQIILTRRLLSSYLQKVGDKVAYEYDFSGHCLFDNDYSVKVQALDQMEIDSSELLSEDFDKRTLIECVWTRPKLKQAKVEEINQSIRETELPADGVRHYNDASDGLDHAESGSEEDRSCFFAFSEAIGLIV